MRPVGFHLYVLLVRDLFFCRAWASLIEKPLRSAPKRELASNGSLAFSIWPQYALRLTFPLFLGEDRKGVFQNSEVAPEALPLFLEHKWTQQFIALHVICRIPSIVSLMRTKSLLSLPFQNSKGASKLERTCSNLLRVNVVASRLEPVR